MNKLLTVYERRVASGEIEPDHAQRRAAEALDRLGMDLLDARRGTAPWRRRLRLLLGRAGARPPRGVYLWGDVGRGKTYLMDLFYASLPFRDKARRHFHRFMADVHARLKALPDRSDPLERIAKQLARSNRIICLDELSVTDIADAMILGRLFSALFAQGVALAATSNLRPAELYRDGLQRNRFMPVIALLEEHTEIVHVDGGEDYRLRLLERADVYQCPPGPAADARLETYMESMAPDAARAGGSIRLLGRRIAYRRCSDGVIWFDFDALCDGPRSQDDYIELSRDYHTVLLSDVPRFDRSLENQARRFIALVDEFYDRRVKLILSAAAPVEDLYHGKTVAVEFQRTRSRLEEMRTREYLAAPHKP
jgi:cell division protein ZapE